MPNDTPINRLPKSYQKNARCYMCNNFDPKEKHDYYGKPEHDCTLNKQHPRVKSDDEACSSAIIRGCFVNNLGSFHPSGWFIVTKICEIIGKPDNSEIYNTTQQLRQFFSKKEEYLSIWEEYDSIGPIIAEKLDKAENKRDICLDMFFNYLIPCAQSVRRVDIAQTEEEANECYTKALLIYIEMIIEFQRLFSIPNIIPSISGHLEEHKGTGRVRITNDNAETQQ